MEKGKNNGKQGWAAIINAVTTPLGFFALVVLAIEVVLGVVASSVSDPPRAYLVGSMIVLLFALVGIVALLAYSRPEVLVRSVGRGDPAIREPADAEVQDRAQKEIPHAIDRAAALGRDAASAPKKDGMSWDDIDDAATRLYNAILRAGFEPDTIVGVGRGGAIALGVVAARFRQRHGAARRLHPVQLLDRRYLRRDDYERKTVIIGLHTLDVQNRNVLLLNADSYTGATINEARDAIQRLGPRLVMTGALYLVGRNGGEIYDPDFHGKTLRGHHAAIRLPWREEHYTFEEAIDTTELVHRTLIILHGLVGTGKTSVTNTIVKQLGCYPLHTDEYWFRHGLRGRHIDPGVSAEHYDLMHDLCWSVIGSGRDAVLDCTSRWRTFRAKLLESFEPWGVTLVHVRCACSEASARQRIAQRKRFGPHDLGDEIEYRRVLHDYNPITEREAARINLVHLDTDELTCDVVHVHERDAQRVQKVCQAIEAGYFARLRA